MRRTPAGGEESFWSAICKWPDIVRHTLIPRAVHRAHLASAVGTAIGLTNRGWWGFRRRSSRFETITAERAVSPAGGNRRRRDRYGAPWRSSIAWKLFPKLVQLWQMLAEISNAAAHQHDRLNSKPNRQKQDKQQDDSSPAHDNG